MRRTYLNLIGNPNSGKSTVANHLAEKYGFRVYRPSHSIASYAVYQEIAIAGRTDYSALHRLMRQRLGGDIFQNEILKIRADKICIDGLRVPADVRALREKVDLATIALWCPIEERFRRQTNDTGIDLELFKIDQMFDYHGRTDQDPSTITVMGNADYHVDASAPLEEVYEAVDGVVDARLAVEVNEKSY